ncbi:MAG TPA: ADP-glyceromanno-heptose 6-epimerase [Kiritimatiellia bacterium]|nr:ADP-glyceromanno-heptose 6-epimerase [Kiritimatiellia bacterium]HMP35095.1 ADP-glyceromanno-heptose 6-epimerase [Kiritimatiellia bacterium]
MSERFIVTGGAGFIGSNIIAALNARGDDNILVVDDLACDEKWKNLVGLKYDDYMDRDTFRRAVADNKLGSVSAIFHMGACSATTETNAAYLADNNFAVTKELCSWCLASGTRFIYASSGATYGDGALGYSDDDAVTPTLRPLNMYGYSKHMFDLWALRNNLLGRIVGLKFFNVYGPREDHKGDMRSVVHKAYGQILATGAVKLFKSYHPDYRDGEQVRDFVYVKDAVNVCLYFDRHRDVSGLFNVGTGACRTWLDLARAVFAAMKRPANIEFIEMPETLRAKYQYHTEARIDKLRAAGYRDAFTTLEAGVADYVSTYLAR